MDGRETILTKVNQGNKNESRKRHENDPNDEMEKKHHSENKRTPE